MSDAQYLHYCCCQPFKFDEDDGASLKLMMVEIREFCLVLFGEQTFKRSRGAFGSFRFGDGGKINGKCKSDRDDTICQNSSKVRV